MPVVTSILNKPITIGILKVIENKQEKNEATGEYVPVSETREINEIAKFFHTETGKTVVELKKKIDLPPEDLFKAKWTEKNAGKTQDRSSKPTATGPAKAGTGSPATNNKSAGGSLFG